MEPRHWLTISANFIAFLKEIEIPAVPTEMTFGVSRDQGLFEWAGTSLSAVFAQRSNLFRLRMWQMIFDIIRFNQFALDLLAEEEESEEDISGANGSAVGGSMETTPKKAHQQSIGEYLDRENYSEAFRNDYLIPMTASVWSTSPDKTSLEFPAITLIRFMWNHHLLTAVAARPTWMTILGGSKQYVDAVMADFPQERVHLGVGIKSLGIQDDGQIRIHRSDSKEELFDHVVLATHGDQAMDIIREVATPREKDIMSGFKTSENTASLHSDLSVGHLLKLPFFRGSIANTTTTKSSISCSLSLSPHLKKHQSQPCFPLPESKYQIHYNPSFPPKQLTTPTQLMPHRPLAWSSWNYITKTPTPTSPPSVCLTYNMNTLQHIPLTTHGPILVTLNPLHPPSPHLTQGTWTYHHPLYNAAAIRSQKLLPSIQNTRGISYAGAWTKYGFHEDGFSSGLKVAVEHLGAELPWEFVDSTFSRGRRPVLGWRDWAVRGFVVAVQGVLFVVGWVVASITGMRKRDAKIGKIQ